MADATALVQNCIWEFVIVALEMPIRLVRVSIVEGAPLHQFAFQLQIHLCLMILHQHRFRHRTQILHFQFFNH